MANAGITVSGSFLARAFTSPVTLGILLGYVAGKPAGTAGAAWLLTRITRGRIRPPVGWAAVTGAGAIAGIGFIVSLDVESADLSGVSGTPTFFINGKRHHGAYDTATLSQAVQSARARTLISPPRRARRAS